MFYIILTAVVIFALVVIFHDDRDGAYNKRSDSGKKYRSEGASRQPAILPPKNVAALSQQLKERPKPIRPMLEKTAPRDKTSVRIAESSARERTLSWSFLYSLEYDEDIVGDTLETEIAGIQHYCSLADAGPVNGTIRPEPDNPYDSRAQVVIRADGKKLGYIPRDVLDEYEDFNEDNLICPFAGQITVDRKGYMQAVILAVLPESRDFVKEELDSFLQEN